MDADIEANGVKRGYPRDEDAEESNASKSEMVESAARRDKVHPELGNRSV
jgi:hypothetical protein